MHRKKNMQKTHLEYDNYIKNNNNNNGKYVVVLFLNNMIYQFK